MHELRQTKIFPSGLFYFLRGLLYPERGVLVGDDIVFVLRVDGLQVGRDVDIVGGELVLAEILKKVGVARVLHVNVGIDCVFVLFIFAVFCISLLLLFFFCLSWVLSSGSTAAV